jgi:hypothetical protein
MTPRKGVFYLIPAGQESKSQRNERMCWCGFEKATPTIRQSLTGVYYQYGNPLSILPLKTAEILRGSFLFINFPLKSNPQTVLYGRLKKRGY